MIKTTLALSVALLLCACGGGNKSADEPAPGGEAAAPAAEESPAADAEQAKAAEPGTEGTAAEPAPGTPAVTITDAEKEQAVAFAEKLADVADANKADCDKMAEAIKTLFDENTAFIEKVNKWQVTASEAETKAFQAKYNDRFEAMGKKLGEALQASSCTQHAGVVEQFKRFQ